VGRPYDDLKLGFNKVAPNYYYPGWWEGGPQLDFFINNKAWESLSAEYKAMVESAAALAHVEMLAKYDYRNPAALKTLVGQGTKLFRFPKDMMEGSFKAAGEIYAELNGSNADWKKIYADFQNWRRDANLWFRFTEAGFDDFMQARSSDDSAKRSKQKPRRGGVFLCPRGRPLAADGRINESRLLVGVPLEAFEQALHCIVVRLALRIRRSGLRARCARARRGRRIAAGALTWCRLHLLEGLVDVDCRLLAEPARNQLGERDDQTDHDDLDDHERHRRPSRSGRS
jgi:hypothetical protein